MSLRAHVCVCRSTLRQGLRFARPGARVRAGREVCERAASEVVARRGATARGSRNAAGARRFFEAAPSRKHGSRPRRAAGMPRARRDCSKPRRAGSVGVPRRQPCGGRPAEVSGPTPTLRRQADPKKEQTTPTFHPMPENGQHYIVRFPRQVQPTSY